MDGISPDRFKWDMKNLKDKLLHVYKKENINSINWELGLEINQFNFQMKKKSGRAVDGRYTNQGRFLVFHSFLGFSLLNEELSYGIVPACFSHMPLLQTNGYSQHAKDWTFHTTHIDNFWQVLAPSSYQARDLHTDKPATAQLVCVRRREREKSQLVGYICHGFLVLSRPPSVCLFTQNNILSLRT